MISQELLFRVCILKCLRARNKFQLAQSDALGPRVKKTFSYSLSQCLELNRSPLGAGDGVHVVRDRKEKHMQN